MVPSAPGVPGMKGIAVAPPPPPPQDMWVTMRVGFWSHWWLEDHPIDVIDGLGGGFKSFFKMFYVHPYFGKWSNLRIIFFKWVESWKCLGCDWCWHVQSFWTFFSLRWMDIRVMFSNTTQDDLQSSYRGCTFLYMNVADEVSSGNYLLMLTYPKLLLRDDHLSGWPMPWTKGLLVYVRWAWKWRRHRYITMKGEILSK